MRRQDAVPVRGLHHLGRRLELDRPREVEALALQEQGVTIDRPKVYKELLFVESLRN